MQWGFIAAEHSGGLSRRAKNGLRRYHGWAGAWACCWPGSRGQVLVSVRPQVLAKRERVCSPYLRTTAALWPDRGSGVPVRSASFTPTCTPSGPGGPWLGTYGADFRASMPRMGNSSRPLLASSYGTTRRFKMRKFAGLKSLFKWIDIRLDDRLPEMHNKHRWGFNCLLKYFISFNLNTL